MTIDRDALIEILAKRRFDEYQREWGSDGGMTWRHFRGTAERLVDRTLPAIEVLVRAQAA